MAGMAVRYWLRMPTLSKFLLLAASPRPHTTFNEKMRDELVFLAKCSVAVGIAFLINQGLMYAAVHESQREALSQASSMPLGSILVVAFFGPGWLLLFGDNDKQQKTNR